MGVYFILLADVRLASWTPDIFIWILNGLEMRFFFFYFAGATAESEPPAPPTKSTADEMSEMAKEQLAKIAKEMGMPVWALYCIGIGKLEFSLVFFGRCCYLDVFRFGNRPKTKQNKKW